MPRRKAPIYKRGKYELHWDERRDGTRRSPYLTIFWYDETARRVRTASTGETTEEEGVIALDRRYLADRGEAPAYCQSCGQPLARGSAYLLTDAIADYRLEVGDERSSGDAIAARLKHVVDYLEAAELVAATCADASTKHFVEKFRAWSRRQPVVWKNKEGVVTVSRPRAPATTEASIVQLNAVLNHAASQKRSDSRPEAAALNKRQVNAVRRVRIDAPVLARMLAYAAEPGKHRGPLHAFLVAEICTLARPSSVVDISTAPDRRQWAPSMMSLNLNYAGRPQTKKFRPIVPVLPLLREWLLSTFADAEAEKSTRRTGHWLVNYFGRQVQGVDRAYTKMLVEVGLPTDREWQPYLFRHSLATIVRGAGVAKWELAGFMGHSSGGETETYAVESEFPNVMRTLQALIDDLETRSPGALHRNIAGEASNVIPMGGRKMPSP